MVLNSKQLSWKSRMDLLLLITDGMANTTVELAYQSVRYPKYQGIVDKDNFDWKSPLVTSWQEDNLDNTDPKVSEDNWSKYYSNNNSFKNDYNKHIIFETKWNLGLHACGSNYKGRNAWSRVKSLT